MIVAIHLALLAQEHQLIAFLVLLENFSTKASVPQTVRIRLSKTLRQVLVIAVIPHALLAQEHQQPVPVAHYLLFWRDLLVWPAARPRSTQIPVERARIALQTASLVSLPPIVA